MWESLQEWASDVWLGILNLSAPVLLYVSALGVGASIALIVMIFKILGSRIPPENREYKEELPPALKIIWPLIRIVSYYLCTNLPIPYLDRLEKRLQQSGVAYYVTAEEFFAIRILSALFFPLLVVLTALMLGSMSPLVFIASFFLGFFLPVIWLNENKVKREKEVMRALPMYLEFISMCVEAGLNLTGAMNQAVEKGPEGALKREFQIVMRDIRSGSSRAEALGRLSERLDIKAVNAFVRAVIQAEKLGSSMSKVLKIQSEQRRSERFQRAEKLAMEAPVKLIFPLMAFIFPVTFMILAFPIVVKFMDQGFIK
jgi:tight adherence protein C